MGLIGVLICGGISIFELYRDKRIYSPIVFFSAFWALLIFFSKLRLYELYETSDYAYLLILLGTLSFVVGATFTRKIKIKPAKKGESINEQRYNWIVVICLCALIYNIRTILMYVSYGFDLKGIYITMARTASGEETRLTSIYSSWQEILQQYIGYPLLYTVVPVSIAAYIKERKKKYLIVAIGLSLIRFLFDLRRTYFVIFIVYIAVFILIRTNEIKFPKWWTKKLKRRICIAGGITVAVFIWISTVRRDSFDEQYSFLKNIYMYYVGSIPYFDQRVNMACDIKYTFGLTSFRGFFAPFFSVLRILGISEPTLMVLATNNIESLHNVVLRITPSHKFNSYATVFFEFFLDGGIIGILVFSFLFGCVAEYLYKRAIRYHTTRDIFRYSYFFSIFMMLSVLHFNGAVVCYIWPFFIESVLFKNEKSSLTG